MKKSVLVDFRISKKSEETLLKRGYDVFKTIKCPTLQDAVCGHADMMLCKLSDNDYVCENTFRGFLVPKIQNKNLIAGISELGEKYPFDIAYNCARVGKFLFCNEKYTDKKILEFCAQNGIKILNTKQGYAKCSICIVSDNAIITADKNIFKLATENKIDVLLTENNGIILNGFNEGFIGGATGLIENDLLAVNGNINLHKSSGEIKAFCLKYGVKILSLSDEPICDIGTIIRL